MAAPLYFPDDWSYTPQDNDLDEQTSSSNDSSSDGENDENDVTDSEDESNLASRKRQPLTSPSQAQTPAGTGSSRHKALPLRDDTKIIDLSSQPISKKPTDPSQRVFPLSWQLPSDARDEPSHIASAFPRQRMGSKSTRWTLDSSTRTPPHVRFDTPGSDKTRKGSGSGLSRVPRAGQTPTSETTGFFELMDTDVKRRSISANRPQYGETSQSNLVAPPSVQRQNSVGSRQHLLPSSTPQVPTRPKAVRENENSRRISRSSKLSSGSSDYSETYRNVPYRRPTVSSG